MAMRLGHRSSYDIDIFFTSSQGLKLLSPQRNSITKAISPRWQEPGHYLKFEVEHVGEIDILVTRDWIDPPTIVARVGEQSMKIQRPSEILVRKAAYRAPSFKIRDFFDLACVATMLPAEFAAAQPELTRHAADLADRWAAIAATADAALAAEVAPLPRGTNVA